MLLVTQLFAVLIPCGPVNNKLGAKTRLATQLAMGSSGTYMSSVGVHGLLNCLVFLCCWGTFERPACNPSISEALGNTVQ